MGFRRLGKERIGELPRLWSWSRPWFGSWSVAWFMAWIPGGNGAVSEGVFPGGPPEISPRDADTAP